MFETIPFFESWIAVEAGEERLLVVVVMVVLVVKSDGGGGDILDYLLGRGMESKREDKSRVGIL